MWTQHPGRGVVHRLVALGLVGLAVVGGAGACGEDGARPLPGMTLGERTALGVFPVPVAGATVVIDRAGDPLDGLTFEFPANAYGVDTTIDVSWRPILEHDLGDVFDPRTPLVTVTVAGPPPGRHADTIIAVTVPVPAAPDRFAMAFLYDETTGRFEALPPLEVSATAITFATRHFSDFVVSSIEVARLLPAIDTGFVHGVDSFAFPNFGSLLEPGGFCAGQSIEMIDYFAHQRRAGAAPLSEVADNRGDRAHPTPDFPYDDASGWRSASVLHAALDFDSLALRVEERFQRTSSDLVTLHAFAYAMLLTHEPQLMFVRPASDFGGHAIVVTSKERNATGTFEVPPLPTVWTCDLRSFDADDGCQCGCGVVDPDCRDATLASCDECGAPGACPSDPSSCQGIDIEYNALCGAVPAYEPVRLEGPAILHVSDPNFPAAAMDRVVVYDFAAGRFATFRSRPDVSSPAEDYVNLYFVGQGAIVDRAVVAAEVERMLNGTGGDDSFPAYTLGSIDAAGARTTVVDDMATDLALLDLQVLDAPSLASPQIIVFDAALDRLGHATAGTVRVPLSLGANRFGVLVRGLVGANQEQVDFRWYDVTRVEAPPPGPMSLVGRVDLPTAATAIDLDGPTAWVGLVTPGLAAVDVADEALPVLRAAIELESFASADGVRALPGSYLAIGAGTFFIVDARDPSAPAVVSETGIGGFCGRLDVLGELAGLACGRANDTLGLIGLGSVAAPADPERARALGGISYGKNARDVALLGDGSRVLSLDADGDLAVFDTSDPANPGQTPIALVESPISGGVALEVASDVAFVLGPGLRVIDVGNPTAPVLLSSDEYVTGFDLAVSGARLIVLDSSSEGGFVALYDVGDPTAPTYVDHVVLPGETPTAVRASGNRAWIATSKAGGAAGGLVIVGW